MNTYTPAPEVVRLVEVIKQLSKGEEFFDDFILYDSAIDLVEEHLVTEEGKPAMRNIEYLNEQGIPVVASDEDCDGFWYGTISVGGLNKIYFKHVEQSA